MDQGLCRLTRIKWQIKINLAPDVKYVIDVNTVIESLRKNQGLHWNGNEGNAKEGDR